MGLFTSILAKCGDWCSCVPFVLRQLYLISGVASFFGNSISSLFDLFAVGTWLVYINGSRRDPAHWHSLTLFILIVFVSTSFYIFCCDVSVFFAFASRCLIPFESMRTYFTIKLNETDNSDGVEWRYQKQQWRWNADTTFTEIVSDGLCQGKHAFVSDKCFLNVSSSAVLAHCKACFLVVLLLHWTFVVSQRLWRCLLLLYVVNGGFLGFPKSQRLPVDSSRLHNLSCYGQTIFPFAEEHVCC